MVGDAGENSFVWLMENWAEKSYHIIATILDSIYNGVLIADEQGIVRYINPKYTKIMGIKSADIVGRLITDLRPGAVLPSVIQSGKPLGGVYRCVGDIEYVVDMAPIFLSGKIVGGISIVKDVTEVRKLIKEVQHYEKKTSHLKSLVQQAYRAQYHFDDILHCSTVMNELLTVVKKVASGDLNVVITGESGTGKELVAESIHNASLRRDGPFVALNCAALTSNLAESELFGYSEGAFTGARKGGKMGVFEIADGGTVLLDEVGELSLTIQAKLLRTLQEYKVRRVGDSSEIPVNVRILACTNRNLTDMVQQGEFREDLYYRLNVVHLQMPPLRERQADIPLLAEKFLENYSHRMQRVFAFSPRIFPILQKHHWPGNIRELANAIEFAVNMCDGSIVEQNNLPKYLIADVTKESRIAKNLDMIVKDTERKAIVERLNMTGVNLTGKKQAAKELGISLATLYNKIKEYRITLTMSDINSKKL